MSFREHPMLLRQSFVKLWPNNIFWQEEEVSRPPFIFFYQTYVLLGTILYYRYTTIVTYRNEETEAFLDYYLNLYKYQKNKRWRKVKPLRGRREVIADRFQKWGKERSFKREENQKSGLLQRFIKTQLYQQFLRTLWESVTTFFGALLRTREPIRRLRFMNRKAIAWFRRNLGSVQKEKHFLNTINQVILLHYYKSTPLFAEHLGRELVRVHKKVHWRLIYHFGHLLQSVPSYPPMRRQFFALLIEIKGRPRGRSRTFIFRIREGAVAPQSYFFRISFGMGEALAKVGALGIKIWLTH